MRRTFTLRRIFAAAAIAAGLLIATPGAFADRHNSGHDSGKGSSLSRPGSNSSDRGHNSGHRDKNKHDKDKNKHDKNKHNNDKYRPGQQNWRPGHDNGRHNGWRPKYPAHRPNHSYAAPGHFHRNLQKMVHQATRGAHDINVWQVDYDTYVVRYRKGHQWYTQYLYPDAWRYGPPSLITVNWSPLSPWHLIPSIQLNINI